MKGHHGQRDRRRKRVQNLIIRERDDFGETQNFQVWGKVQGRTMKVRRDFFMSGLASRGLKRSKQHVNRWEKKKEKSGKKRERDKEKGRD